MTTATPRPIARRLVDLAWPIIGLNMLQVLALAVDTAMVGRTAGPEVALTGMGYASQLVFLLMVGMIGLTVGTVAQVARAFGAGQTDRVDHLLQQSTQLTILLGLTVAVVGNLIAGPLLTLLGADAASTEAGLAYLRPLLLGTAFNYLNILFAAVLRGVRNTRLAFLVAVVMNGLNFVFNYALILGNLGMPALGIQGAALGTIAAQACAVVMMFALLRGGAVAGVRARLGLAAIDGVIARNLIRIGWPAALDMIILNAAFLSILGMLGRIDQVAVAAHGIGLRVQALAFVPGMSISQATGALVGNALGAGLIDEARRVVKASIVLSTLVMSTLAFLLIAFAEPIVGLFDIPHGTPLFDYSVMWLTLLGWGMPIVGTYISFVGMLQGAGATKVSLRINGFVTIFVQVPASYVMGFVLDWGVWGVWAAFPLGFVLKALWGTLAYREGSWARVGDRA